MNDTLSMPDPAAQVAEVRRIIDGRTLMHSCESILAEIKRVVTPPPGPHDPPELTGRGWPILRPSDPVPPGTAWERHDDPRA